jgi:hypothetical protein
MLLRNQGHFFLAKIYNSYLTLNSKTIFYEE